MWIAVEYLAVKVLRSFGDLSLYCRESQSNLAGHDCQQYLRVSCTHQGSLPWFPPPKGASSQPHAEMISVAKDSHPW